MSVLFFRIANIGNEAFSVQILGGPNNGHVKRFGTDEEIIGAVNAELGHNDVEIPHEISLFLGLPGTNFSRGTKIPLTWTAKRQTKH